MSDTSRLLHEVAEAVDAILRAAPHEGWGADGGPGASGHRAKHVDVLAEREVLRVLEEAGNPFNVCSEEIGVVDHGADRTLIIDPVDGTLNAVRGIPFYCISLAVARTGVADVEHGLVRNLPTGDVYEARLGEGATLNGERIRTRPFDPKRAVRSPLPRAGIGTGLSDLVANARYVRGMGAAALEMALVAQGAMDVFVNVTTGLRIVDIAAATLIVREAGGAVVTPVGQPPDLGLDPAARTWLVAAGDPDALKRGGVLA